MLYNNVIIQVNIHFAIVAIGNDYESNVCEHPFETSSGTGSVCKRIPRDAHGMSREYAGSFPLLDAVALWSVLVVEDLAWTESKEL